ncbi:hypothetical protein KAR91_12700 [Candidatus Pacearchaeota archaeon]|nr:hypothetical protein [Candidatus Pacearchaeota archaeon]
MENEQQIRREIHDCKACGRDFTVEVDKSTHAMRIVFCPDCLEVSPYLLED